MLTELIVSGALIASGPIPHTGDVYFDMPSITCYHNEQGDGFEDFPAPPGTEITISVSFTNGSVERIDFEVVNAGVYQFYAWANTGECPGTNPCAFAINPFIPPTFGPVDLSALGSTATVTIVHLGDTWAAECRVGVAEVTPDFNRDGLVNSQDFFDFLNAFLAGSPAADFNRDTLVDSADFFAFLNAFFST